MNSRDGVLTGPIVRTLLEESLVWDNHGCMPLRPQDDVFLSQLSRYKASGVNVVSLNIGFGGQGVDEHVRMVAHLRRWLMLRKDEYVLVQVVEDIERARKAKKLAIVFDIEGMNAISDQLSLIQLYYDLGVRWMLVAYNRHNRAGGGCQQEGDLGLTAFGRRVLDEMARVGMVVCCSHTGYRTSMDVLSYASRPVIFSHSNPRAIHDHPRNICDEALKACAATGGVVGINGIGIFVTRKDDLVAAYVRHIDYVAQLIGVEHVGLGLDYVFDRGELDDLISGDPATFPRDLGYHKGVSMVPPEALGDIVDRLVRLGYSECDLRSILGGNFLRVARAVWRPPLAVG
ncbi:MAG: membrane dipeptidase [Emcibacter sp.]|nr:membrane dipeptidase [Emcibacter sp.]